MPSRRRYSTSTLGTDGLLVPWLAAEGPLSYNPTQPPSRDYFFQYGWVLPGIFDPSVNPRRHYYFGSWFRQAAAQLFSFWEAARRGEVAPLWVRYGRIRPEEVRAPIAAYRIELRGGGPGYLLIQHGSYQWGDTADQPRLGSGELLIYRGLGKSDTFRRPWNGGVVADARRGEVWRRYCEVLATVLSDATLSFNSIHDRARRLETGHILDRTCMTDDVARGHGLDLQTGVGEELWGAVHQSFSLARWVAARKFGPNYVVCKTPIDNVRITTFFANEHEVRVVDPARVELVELLGEGSRAR